MLRDAEQPPLEGCLTELSVGAATVRKVFTSMEYKIRTVPRGRGRLKGRRTAKRFLAQQQRAWETVAKRLTFVVSVEQTYVAGVTKLCCSNEAYVAREQQNNRLSGHRTK